MKSKAMVVVEPNRMELKEFEVSPPAPDQILVKTTVTSVCSSDIKFFHGTFPAVNYPVIMGHEISGRVVEAGPEAKRWYGIKPGDKITVEPYIPCGRCEASRSEHFYHHCDHGGIYGLNLACDRPPHLFGGYSEYFYVMPGTSNYSFYDRIEHLERYTHDWERPFLESSRDFIYKNSFADCEFICALLRRHGVRAELEIFCLAHLYNLAELVDRGFISPPLHVEFVMGLLGAVRAENAQVVAHHVKLAQSLGRRVATPADARRILKLKGCEATAF